MLVVDGLNIATDHVHPKYGRRTDRLDEHGALTIGLSKCAYTEGDSDC